MKNCNYRGVVVPMVTPVTETGKLDTPAVERIIEFFAANNVAPLLMGTTRRRQQRLSRRRTAPRRDSRKSC